MQTEQKTVHQGRNVKRIREILGIKQEALASGLGISQQAISQLEQKEALDKEMLQRVAEVLKVTPEAIERFDEEKTIQIISNTFNDSSVLNGINYFPTFNAMDKMVELYEALLKSEREKIELLERMLKDKS